MKAAVYITEIPEKYERKNMEHLTGEKLLETALFKEYGKTLAFEPRAKGEHGKPFFTLQPKIHYNISHSGKYVVCVMADREVGIDIQEHREAKYESILERLVPAEMVSKIMGSENMVKEFYDQWVLREAYIKWTGEGFSRELKTIPMDRGGYAFLDIDRDYSCAVWAGETPEIIVKQVEVSLEF